MILSELELHGHMLGLDMTARITRERENTLRVLLRLTEVLDNPVGKHAEGFLIDLRDGRHVFETAQRIQWALDDADDPSVRTDAVNDYFDLLMTFKSGVLEGVGR